MSAPIFRDHGSAPVYDEEVTAESIRLYHRHVARIKINVIHRMPNPYIITITLLYPRYGSNIAVGILYLGGIQKFSVKIWFS